MQGPKPLAQNAVSVAHVQAASATLVSSLKRTRTQIEVSGSGDSMVSNPR